MYAGGHPEASAPSQVNGQPQPCYPPTQPGFGDAGVAPLQPDYTQQSLPNTLPPQAYGAPPTQPPYANPQPQVGAPPTQQPSNCAPPQAYGAPPTQPPYANPQPQAYGAPLQQQPVSTSVPPASQEYGVPNQPAYSNAAPLPQAQPATQYTAWAPTTNEANEPSFKWDDGPDSDPDDDENAQEATTELPANVQFTPVPGYDSIMFNEVSAPPPVYQPPPAEKKPDEVFESTGAIDEEQIRSAILDFVAKNCCYGAKPAREMTFDKILPSSALHYKLETYTESRTTKRVHVPYRGGMVDGAHMGVAPLPWAMHCQPDSLFLDHTKTMEVPHTSDVRECHNCFARGFVRCGRCHGRGRVRCSSCHGSGHKRVHRDGEMVTVSCHSCHGSGRRRCFRCGGDGRITCPVCEGCRQLRFFIKLFINYTNHVSDYIHETTDLPDHLIRNVNGQTLFEQTLEYVWPISQYSVPEINQNSIGIVESHRSAWPNERQLQQRQNLRAVPVSEVHYKWKDDASRFWVYGFESDVYCPDYPHTCCWGCNIL